MLLAEVTAARLLTVKSVISHELTDLNEVKQTQSLLKLNIKCLGITRNTQV